MSIKERYSLTISGFGIFGTFTAQYIIWRKYPEGFGLRINGKLKTPGRSYLKGATLEEAIKNIERGGEYADRKVVKIEEVR